MGIACLAADPSPGPSAQTALQWIRYGNERHMAGKYVHWHQSAQRRADVAGTERPHTIVVSCSDSRVPPEVLFDQGLGDLFVVRVAGNVIGDHELASIEYAAHQLGAPLVVVLGHQRCGFVAAAVRGGEMPGRLGSIAAAMAPALARAKSQSGDRVEQTIQANVTVNVESIRSSEPVLSRLAQAGKLEVTGAYYSLDTGEVRWLDSSSTRTEVSSLPH
jgi:carbonic anhydrase